MGQAHLLADRFQPAWDHCMTTSPASELILAADFSCSGLFSTVGAIREPSLALSVAVKDLATYQDNPELRPVVVHVLASRIAGGCHIRGSHIRRALSDCLAGRIALEWKITVPAIGCILGVFLVTRLDKAGQPNLFNLALQLAGKPSFETAAETQAEEAAPPRRACSLLRIF